MGFGIIDIYFKTLQNLSIGDVIFNLLLKNVIESCHGDIRLVQMKLTLSLMITAT